MTLRLFEISFSLWYILFIKMYLLFFIHILNHEFKKSQCHSDVLTAIYCYLLLLFIKKTAVNITDFPEPLKIYKKSSCRVHMKSNTLEFFVNGAELSLNSVISANSGNLINH